MKEIGRKQLKILDFDIENRPLSYWVADMTTAEITAIACSWVGQQKVEVQLLTREDNARQMLEWFRRIYDEADMVTGHYIRKHDLPIVNSALLEYEIEPLSEKLTQDTKMDLVKKKDMSASQESLAAMYGLERPKHHMTQQQWREGNRLTKSGIQYTKKRVTEDVKQHKELREKLIENGALKAPKIWRP